MEDEKKSPARNFIRVNTQVDAWCVFTRLGQEIIKQGIVVDISGGGIKMLSTEHFKKDSDIVLKMNLPDGVIEIPGTVISSEIQWYVGDQGKKTQWVSCVKFTRLTPQVRSRVINFVHRLAADIREAKIKKNRP